MSWDRVAFVKELLLRGLGVVMGKCIFQSDYGSEVLEVTPVALRAGELREHLCDCPQA